MAQLSRRTFMRGALVLLGTAAASPVLAGCAAGSGSGVGGLATSTVNPDKLRALPIPPVYEGTVRGNTRHFDLAAQAGTSEVKPGVQTPTWGFNGPYLGPTLRMHRGDAVEATVKNDLEEMTSVHWHGMQLPAKADGGPHSPIQPGETWNAAWSVNQSAATLWYHPHPHGMTEMQAYHGLAGMIIIDDDVSDGLAVPHDYGVDDIPVVIMDQKFAEDGAFDMTMDETLGLLGDTPVVNGITDARFDATTRSVRLRILQGAGMRFYNLEFSDQRTFQVIATDDGFLPEPVEADSALLGPGERLEVVVELKSEETIHLVSAPLANNFGIPRTEGAADFGFQDSFILLTLRGPASDSPESAALPKVLDPAASTGVDVTGAPTRDFVLKNFQINGQSMDMYRVDATIDHRGPEVWTVKNDNPDWPHNFHIHNARFQVLDMSDNPVPEIGTIGWKDTVGIAPGATATLAVEFGYYPDPNWAYMYHCHMLWHEDNGMMGQFVIVEPGQKADLHVDPAAVNESINGKDMMGMDHSMHNHG